MKLWRHAVITYLRLARKAGILKTDLSDVELRELLAGKYEVDWHVFTQVRISKRHFLGYAARYDGEPAVRIRKLFVEQTTFRLSLRGGAKRSACCPLTFGIEPEA